MLVSKFLFLYSIFSSQKRAKGDQKSRNLKNMHLVRSLNANQPIIRLNAWLKAENSRFINSASLLSFIIVSLSA